MTRTAAGWRDVIARYRRNSETSEDRAARYDALSVKHADMQDVLVAEVYQQASYLALAEADYWRDAAARAEACALDAATHEPKLKAVPA